ncbi:F-box protein At5g52880 isoform X1 [Cucurbita moschata]|uniref:F-box protein At5g52880 isoform X1 n=1 Tax=Cucurbita moschata TaxID=3662 RepID=A0A6J1E2E9_CUCMO|nr:F-box protein At5g52880 isoform X1 [Cucurbita moschata]
MTDPLERYQNLALTDSLAKSYSYPLACKELSFITRGAFNKLPKNLQSLIFQHIITAFHLLPEMQTSSAVSAAHLLAQGVEASLPKQKRNSAIVEFKKAMVAHKRRSKARQEVKGSSQLPQDVLLHIFRFLDIESLVSAGLVCRSWNAAADDEYLWQFQYTTFFGCSDEPINDKDSVDGLASTPHVDWKEAFKGAYVGNSLWRNRSGRGYCKHCDTIVSFSTLRCPNDHGRNKNKQIKPLSINQVVEYVLTGTSELIYSSDSDTDSDEVVISEFWALPKYLGRRRPN